jgi:hypothetical protein
MFNPRKRENLNIEKKISQEPENSLLVFEKVRNKVVYVNPEIIAPLKLEKWEESPLGLFAKAALAKGYELKPDEQRLESWPEHRRSALLGKVIFKDKDGRLYRDIDLKGIGYIGKNKVLEPGKNISTLGSWRGAEVEGFLESEEARRERDAQENFLKAGIRTARTLAIIELKEIIFKGEKISLSEARKREVIERKINRGLRILTGKESFPLDPVVQVRAFGTKARIRDVLYKDKDNKREQQSKIFLNDAKKLVSQEIGKDLSSNKDYFEWFAKTLGANVALMHKNGWYHQYLADHNITLDCRIVDVGHVDKLKTEKQRLRDIKWAMDSLKLFADRLGFRMDEFENEFFESYNNVFSPEKAQSLHP